MDSTTMKGAVHTFRMAFAGTTTADKLHSVLDTLRGTRSEGLPLAEV